MTIYLDKFIHPYVYRLDHPVSGEFYIGVRSANKFPSALDLGHKYFTSSKLVKPRFNEFKATIVAEFFDADAAYDFEQLLIHESWGNKSMLNKVCHYGASPRFTMIGQRHSEEHKRKMSEALKGKPLSEEHKLNISEALKGLTRSEETKCKISEAKKGNPRVMEHLQKLSEARKGTFHSEETKRKMSEARKGNPRWPCSEETKRKISETLKLRRLLSLSNAQVEFG